MSNAQCQWRTPSESALVIVSLVIGHCHATSHIDNPRWHLHPRGMAKPALGRGLGALLGGATPIARSAPPTVPSPSLAAIAPVAPGERVERIALAQIRPCPFQPRK